MSRSSSPGFYVFEPSRLLVEIDPERRVVTNRILKMIGGFLK